MMLSSSFSLFASVVSCTITACLGIHYPSIYYVVGNCDQRIDVEGDMRIQLAPTAYLPSGRHCALSFQKSTGNELAVKFLSYNMSSNYTRDSGNCQFESIQLYDALQQPRLSPPGSDDDYCSSHRPTGIYYIGASGKLAFSTGMYDNISTAGVDVLVSEISSKKSFTNSICTSSFFDCGNGYCVSKDITCNGYDDCGNNADENCNPDTSLSAGTVAGIVIGVILGVTAVVIVSLLFRRYRRRVSYAQNF